jgi:Glycerophosphoryl diester phosphodiesterase family
MIFASPNRSVAEAANFWILNARKCHIRPMKEHYLGVLLLAVSGFASASAEIKVQPLIQAHAHNDYAHARPLLDALEHGFCSVEADIYLVEGQLLVAHDRDQLEPGRTLQALYLDPLRDRVKKNGGRVFPNGPELTLLIDIKSEAEPTYAVLQRVLNEYAEMLTVFRTNATESKAVTVILSGNRPQVALAKESLRYAAIDGRLPDLESNASRHLIPLISDNWTRHFQWRGTGAMPEDERRKLKEIVMRTHQQGRRLRFWGTADGPEVWGQLQQAGVDLINTDDLAGLQKFFLTNSPPRSDKP